MNERIKISSSHSPAIRQAIKRIIADCYPEWKGRKIHVSAATRYQMTNYWSEGSRDYVVAYNPATRHVGQPAGAATNPFRKEAHVEVTIPAGVLLVEHSIFCGKDAGITIYVNPESAATLLPGLCLTEAQKAEADRTIERTFGENVALTPVR